MNIAVRTRKAGAVLNMMSTQEKNAILESFADRLNDLESELLTANAEDIRDAKATTLRGQLIERLRLNSSKLRQMTDAIRQVITLPDPAGRTLRHTLLDDGLELRQVTVPFGTVLAIIESRPDAVVQLISLMVKSGNALIVKAGHEARATVAVIQRAIHESLARHGVPIECMTVIYGREAVAELLTLSNYIDLVVPRGSKELIQYVQEHTRIPVIGHADGICHIYVDAEADCEMATRIILDAKTQAPSACNAVETVLIHHDAAGVIPPLLAALRERGVAVRGCEQTAALAGAVQVEAIGDESEWATEYGDLTVAIRVVENVEAAMAHIAKYGSHHTDAIITKNEAVAERFLAGVDSANVYHNASTRFADGYRYGLGAEVGISTGKLPPRGPVGLDGLVTYKWVLRGAGHISATYQGEQAKPFKHTNLSASSGTNCPTP
ncbi:MAG: glutamate-5-semialdehyde dehydrogenase [Acidobacteria bacterium]|nr:MAG: glutamate-5-semialdehyde dehydrogenase [Acidobacteriota bacterium]